MTIEAGMTYTGQFGSKRRVLSVDEGVVTYQERISLREAEMSEAEFQAWVDLAP